MSEVITEIFKQSLFCPPSGEKRTFPTIFDEMRWAMQHSQHPLEQITQLISEFHGVWTGMSSTLLSFISYLASLSSSSNSASTATYLKSAQAALNLLNTVTYTSQIGRINNITASSMSNELLREFVARSQSLHPAINAYIQSNIGKYPYHQQISEAVCHFGQIVLKKTQVDPIKRSLSNGDVNMNTNYRLRRNTNTKLFDNIKPVVDMSANLIDVLFLRGMHIENNMSLLHQNYSTGPALPHGHTFTMDVFDKDRSKAAIQPSIMAATQKFGDALRLCNWAFPVDHQIQKQPQWFGLTTEKGFYIADELNRPPTRDVVIPIASTNDKTAIS
jgi:hypothetical protein